MSQLLCRRQTISCAVCSLTRIQAKTLQLQSMCLHATGNSPKGVLSCDQSTRNDADGSFSATGETTKRAEFPIYDSGFTRQNIRRKVTRLFLDMATKHKPLVGIIMGSQSDWETMQHAALQLDALKIPYETSVVSAHRTPDWLFEYADAAAGRGLEVIIAGAGGAAHLPGMCASKTALPVLGVPVESKALKGLDSLLSIAQMPGGIPVGTLAIGKAGAINAALLASAILGNKYPEFRKAYEYFRSEQTKKVLANRKLPATKK